MLDSPRLARDRNMHELAVCQALLEQVESIARARGAESVSRVAVRLGPLSGVEPELLARAFTIARAGSVAAGARLDVETTSVRVACTACGAETEAAVNRLVCAACGNYRTRLVAGDELQLAALDLDRSGSRSAEGKQEIEEEPTHV